MQRITRDQAGKFAFNHQDEPLLRVDCGETFEVEPGSVTFQGIEQAHGIYNPGDESLAFLRIAIGVPGEEFTTIDLDDDLASRRSPGST